MSRNTSASVSLAALRHNLATVALMAPGAGLVSVVKADAYGHGMAVVTEALRGSELLAVATVGELEAVRTGGWSGRLLLLEGFFGADEYAAVKATGAEFVVHQHSQLELLRRRGGLGGRPAWLKINTGMNRLGFPPRDVAAVTSELRSLCGGVAPVLMTHFACADDPQSPMTRSQLALFHEVTAGLPGPRCVANSAAILNFPDACCDLVRPGVMLYGISPLPGHCGADHGLQQVMTLSCPIIAINQCRAGDTVGYGAAFTCPEDMRIGVAGIGYGDGYPRSAANGTPVLVNGRRASLAGRVSMDMITIDLRGHDSAREGDTVTLWGGGLAVEEVARHAGAIPYELVCGITGRVQRTVT